MTEILSIGLGVIRMIGAGRSTVAGAKWGSDSPVPGMNLDGRHLGRRDLVNDEKSRHINKSYYNISYQIPEGPHVLENEAPILCLFLEFLS